MKTINTFPKLIAVFCLLLVLPGLSIAQYAEKKVRINIQKEEDGKKINIDTLISHKDLPAFKEYLSTLGIHMEHKESHEGHKRIMIKTDGKNSDEDIEKHVEILELKSEGDKSENAFIMKSGNADDIEWVSDDKSKKKMKKRKMKKGEAAEPGVKKIIIMKDGETGEVIREEIISDDKGTGESGQHDKIIIVKDGKTGEVITEQIISVEGADGKEIKVNVITDGDMSDVTIDAADGKKVIVIEEEHEMENENGKTKHVFVMIRVEMSDLEDEDINNWVEKGEDQAKLTSTLEANDLSFYPNPNDGSFTLKFSLADQGKTSVRIVDLNGKEVYSELMEDFSGEYEKAIDISEEAKGVYLLQVTQGAETLNKKIILE